MNSTSADCALLIIDMQRDFLAPGGYAEQAGLAIDTLRAPIPRIQALLQAARSQGLTIIYTREGHRADLSDVSQVKLRRSQRAGATIGSAGPMGRLLIRGEYGHDIIDELTPQRGEILIDKPGYGAFHQTDLALILHNRGIQRLLLTGVTTDICVHSTLREAVDRGFDCLTVSDACAATHTDIHAAMLACIQGEGGILGSVQTTAEVLRSMQHNEECYA